MSTANSDPMFRNSEPSVNRSRRDRPYRDGNRTLMNYVNIVSLIVRACA